MISREQKRAGNSPNWGTRALGNRLIRAPLPGAQPQHQTVSIGQEHCALASQAQVKNWLHEAYQHLNTSFLPQHFIPFTFAQTSSQISGLLSSSRSESMTKPSNLLRKVLFHQPALGAGRHVSWEPDTSASAAWWGRWECSQRSRTVRGAQDPALPSQLDSWTPLW